MLRDYLAQRSIHIDRHARGVAADEEVAAGFEPGEEFCSVFSHSMLNVKFLGAVAGINEE